jgi:hypothetical protein
VVLALEGEPARVAFCLPAACRRFAFGRVRLRGLTSAVAVKATAVPAAAFTAFDLAAFLIMRPALDAGALALPVIAPIVPLDLRIEAPTRSCFAETFAYRGLFPLSVLASHSSPRNSYELNQRFHGMDRDARAWKFARALIAKYGKAAFSVAGQRAQDRLDKGDYRASSGWARMADIVRRMTITGARRSGSREREPGTGRPAVGSGHRSGDEGRQPRPSGTRTRARKRDEGAERPRR